MAEGGSESDSLKIFAKNHNKYGTTTKSTYTNDKFRKYFVLSGDTLQGIALKCGVSMEEIRRANNIWANDSLYLRDYLLIPILNSVLPNGLSEINDNKEETMNCEHPDYEIVTRQDIIAAQKKLPKSQSCSAVLSTVCECPKPTNAKDFLSRYDNGFAKIKADVERLEGRPSKNYDIPKSTLTKDFLSRYDNGFAKIKANVDRYQGEVAETSFLEEDSTSNPLTLLPKKKSHYGSRKKRRSLETESTSLFVNETAEPDLVVITSSRNGRSKLKTSMEKLKKREDDLFQL